MMSTRFVRGLLAIAATIAAIAVYAVLAGGSGGAGPDALSVWPEGRPSVPLPEARSGDLPPFRVEVIVAAESGSTSNRFRVTRSYQAMNLWRRERHDQDRPGFSLIIADGTTRWNIDPAEKTYRRSPVGRMAQWEVQHLEIPNQLAGIGPTNFDSLEDLVAFVSNFTAEVSQRGKEMFRSVETQVIEYQGRELPGAPRMSGVMWIDTSGRKMVVLRHVEEMKDNRHVSRVVAEVAAIEYGASFSPSLFEFDPAGYTELR